MEYCTSIQRAIDYIEEHLKDDLDNASLARIAGYSEFHFLRLFKETVRLTPADYIRKRRISEIVRQISAGKSSISDAAFEYGFHSKENFIRAFKREHHILPTAFKAARNSLKLYGKQEWLTADWQLTPDIQKLDSFQLVVYPSDEAFPPHFWNKYNATGCSKRLSGGQTVADYGVSIWNTKQDKLDYFIGIREEFASGCREHTQILNIPGGLYAVFETPPATSFDFVNTIHRTWRWIAEVWLPQSGFRRIQSPEFETYVEESRTFQEKIYIPIKPKE